MKGLSKSELQFFEQLKEYIDNEEIYCEILKVFFLYVEGILGADEQFMLVEKFFDRDPEDIFERFKNLTFSREQGWRKISWFCWNLQEFGQGETQIQRIDSSYSRLPQEFLMPICTGKDELGELVLNDTLVSIPHGSEHF